MNDHDYALARFALTAGFVLGGLAWHLLNRAVLRLREFLALRAMMRGHAAALADARAKFAARPKAKIKRVGMIERDMFGRPGPGDDWEFELPEGAQLNVYRGPDGECCHGGWTHEELAEVARRGKEFAG